MEYVILVDEVDKAIGTAEKMAAHAPPGKLHRALSVVLMSADGRVLLQQRAATKHHFRGMWSNTCCSHPRPGEEILDAGRRRLREEMGIDLEQASVGTYRYQATDHETGLVENELVHVLVGEFDGTPSPNPREAQAWDWSNLDMLRADLEERPERYTPWLPLALDVAAPLPA